jgi:hypothetical protein
VNHPLASGHSAKISETHLMAMRMTSEWTASSYEVAPDISSFDPYFSRDEIPFWSNYGGFLKWEHP